MTLYILKYNNYYNRLVKREDDMSDYAPYVIYTLLSTNFNPNDGVNTTHVIGVGEYDGMGDYLIAYENNIVSRWFIIESQRTRAGQYQLVLRRDLVVDYYNIIVQSPMFIEKATVTDNDPAIWNSEEISVNLIKTSEYLIQDQSKCSWIVGYFARDYNPTETIKVTYSNPTASIMLLEGESLDETAYRVLNYVLYFDASFDTGAPNSVDQTNRYTLGSTSSQWTYETIGYLGKQSLHYTRPFDSPIDVLASLNNTAIKNAVPMYYNSGHFYSPAYYMKELKSLNGKVAEDTNGIKYKITATTTTVTHERNISSLNLTLIDGLNAIYSYINDKLRAMLYAEGRVDLKLQWTEEVVTVRLRKVSFDSFNITFPGTLRKHLQDAPYDMFCIPYKDGGLKFIYKEPVEDVRGPFSGVSISKEGALTAAQSLAQSMGTNLYDLQLLPYCPLTGWSIRDGDTFYITDDSKINETGDGSVYSNQFFYDYDSGFIMFFCTQSSAELNSDQLVVVDSATQEELSLPVALTNKKLLNNCDMWRLCSPNYNGQFQFNAAKLDGITGFNVDYTYLPYSPYIHVNPNFSGLYGQDFDDARGLICQGDFSISYMSDAWVQYLIQNKNYANTFNRQIDNMEINQDVQRKQQVFSAATGTVSGALSGATAGALAGSSGGPWGAVAGAAVGLVGGGIASGIGGALDVKYGDILRNEALDYTKDMYNYQLDNIKALPSSVLKVTAYTRNNKIFPVLEYYTCTDIEKTAVANKIAYNGMTVMRIGFIEEFVNNTWSYNDIKSKGYIKGQLIRFIDDGEDYHVVNAIAGELVKGVFIN